MTVWLLSASLAKKTGKLLKVCREHFEHVLGTQDVRGIELIQDVPAEHAILPAPSASVFVLLYQ